MNFAQFQTAFESNTRILEFRENRQQTNEKIDVVINSSVGASSVSSQKTRESRAISTSSSQILPLDYTPSPWTVLCGRGKDNFNSTGNRRLRVLVERNLTRYKACDSKMKKSVLFSTIVDMIREATNDVGAFVKYDSSSNRWYEVNESAAREKVGQLFREMVSQRDPSIRQARRDRRRELRQKQRKERPISLNTAKEDDDSSNNGKRTVAETAIQSKTTATLSGNPATTTMDDEEREDKRSICGNTMISLLTAAASQVDASSRTSFNEDSGIYAVCGSSCPSSLFNASSLSSFSEEETDLFEPLDYTANEGFFSFCFNDMET